MRCIKKAIVGFTKNVSLSIDIRIVEFLGFWDFGRSRVPVPVYKLCLIYSILYLINIYLTLIFNYDFNSFMTFMQFSVLHLSIPKIFTYIKSRDKWMKIIELIAEIEEYSLKDKKSKYKSMVLMYRKYSHIFVIVFWISVIIIHVAFMGIFWPNYLLLDATKVNMKQINIFNVWLPIDEYTLKGRIVSGILQTIFIDITAVYIISWDTLAMSCLIFFIGQLKALRIRCVHLLEDPSEDMCMDSIFKCHQHYLKIVR